MSPFVTITDLHKIYTVGEIKVHAADGISLEVEAGEFAVVAGTSGAGKSTVLNILGGMDMPTSGEIMVDGVEVSALNKRGLADYRRNDVGFVFQFYNLVQNLTALENVELALQICKDPLDPKEILKNVGLADRMDNFPAQLSGGEQQRVSIARAIAKNPKLLLCDEPTGALDYKTGKTVLSLLWSACRTHGKTVIIITHNFALAAAADRVIELKSGKVSRITRNPNPVPIDTVEW